MLKKGTILAKRIRTLSTFNESLQQTKDTDYSLLTLGLISILEKELNDVRKRICKNEAMKPLTLKKLFDYFKGIVDDKIIEDILPLYYSLRLIREESLEDIIRVLRNKAAHGEISDHSYEEYKMVEELCMGELGLFRAISITKMNLNNQVVLDKNMVLSLLVDLITTEGFLYEIGE